MEFLKEIRNYPFEGYDDGAIAATKENIKELTRDSDIVWSSWKKDGLDVVREFKIDFDFYSSDKEGVSYFTRILQVNSFEVTIKPKRFLLFFKAYKVRASFNRIWTLEELNETIELIGLFARKYNILIESFGSHLKGEVL